MKAGWTTKRLGEVILKTETIDPGRRPDASFTYIDVSSVSSGTLAIEETQRVFGRDAPSRARKLIRKSDVLFATIRPTLRRIAIVPESLDGEVCSTGYFVLRAGSEVLPRFLYYFLQSETFMSSMEALQKGASYPAVTDGDVREQFIPLPPLPEQRRIVALFDEAFAGLATAAANAERNLDNARELFESYLAEVFSRRGDGWVERRLDEVCSITSTLVDPREARYQDLTHVGAGNIESVTGCFIELKSAREEQLISGKFLFDESMVLYSKIRPYLRKVARPEFGGLCSADMYPLAPNGSLVTRDFLFYLLLSRRFTEYAIKGSARAGMPKVNREHLFAFRAWFPDFDFQRELTATLDASASASQQLVNVYEQKQAALAELKKSLLHQAFSGSL